MMNADSTKVSLSTTFLAMLFTYSRWFVLLLIVYPSRKVDWSFDIRDAQDLTCTVNP